jgi:Flp pilus assembly CpaF family ATPase
MLQAMNTGHDGSLGTIHANRPREALTRLENMVAMTGIKLPHEAVRAQIAGALNMIVQVSRMRDGVRRITHISEVVGMEGDVITMQDLSPSSTRARTRAVDCWARSNAPDCGRTSRRKDRPLLEAIARATEAIA